MLAAGVQDAHSPVPGEEFGELFEMIRIDEIDPGVDEFPPSHRIVRRSPKTNLAALSVSSSDELAELLPFRRREFSKPFPFEVVVPVVADDPHEVGREVALEIGHSSVE